LSDYLEFNIRLRLPEAMNPVTVGIGGSIAVRKVKHVALVIASDQLANTRWIPTAPHVKHLIE
jgi:hypothetical protein